MQDLDPIADLNYRVCELERREGQTIQIAQVTYVYRKSSDPEIKSDRDDGSWLGYVDVMVDDHEVQRRPFLTSRHGADKTFWLPTKGELGILFSPSGDYANSMYIPGLVYKDFPAHVPGEISLEVEKHLYRDNSVRVINTGEHSGEHYNDYTIPHDNGRIKDTVGASYPSTREHTQPQIEDAVPSGDGSVHQQTGSQIQDTVSDTATELLQAAVKLIEISNTEVRITPSEITGETSSKVEFIAGTTSLTITPGQIEASIGTTRFKFTASKADIRVGTMWIVLTAAIANVNGATFVSGLTNLANAAGPVGYGPVAPGTF